MKAEVLPDDERSFVGNMNEISKDKNVDKEVSLQATNSFQMGFRFPGESPGPRGKIPKTNEQVMCAIAS